MPGIERRFFDNQVHLLHPLSYIQKTGVYESIEHKVEPTHAMEIETDMAV